MDPALSTHGETASRLRLAIARLFRQLKQSNPGELTLSEWSALAAIDEAGMIRNTALAAAENVSPATATRIVASLETEGLITRTPDRTDRRSHFIALSAAGRARLEWARGIAASSLASQLAAMPAEIVSQIEAMLPLLELLADTAADATSPSQSGGAPTALAVVPPVTAAAEKVD
jgi:DNA-binding MarR family transcriptional regulator